MAHHDMSIRERIIALAEEGGLSASTADEQYDLPKSTARAWLQKCRRNGQVGRRREPEFWQVTSPPQDAALVAEAQRSPFVCRGKIKAATGLPGQKTTLTSRLNDAGLKGTTRCGEGTSR